MEQILIFLFFKNIKVKNKKINKIITSNHNNNTHLSTLLITISMETIIKMLKIILQDIYVHTRFLI